MTWDKLSAFLLHVLKSDTSLLPLGVNSKTGSYTNSLLRSLCAYINLGKIAGGWDILV